MHPLVSVLIITAGAVPETTDLEKAVISARDAIHSGDIVFSAETELASPPAGALGRNQIDFHVVFDGARVLFERTMDAPPTFVRKPSGEQVEAFVVGGRTTERILLTENRFYHYIPDRLSSGAAFIISSGSRDAASDDGNTLIRSVFDPRLLGTIPTPISHYSSNTKFSLAVSARENVLVESDTITLQGGGEAKTQKISYTRDSGTKMAIWIAEKMGNSLLRAEIEPFVRQGAPSRLVTYSSDVKQYDGIWFPSRTVYEAIRGGAIDKREVVIVREARFNIDVPDNQFAIDALDPAPGTIMNDEPGIPSQVFRDGEFYPVAVHGDATVRPIAAAQSPRLFVFALASIVLAILLFAFYYLSKRQLRQ
ncbi:MAG: outer membrane lipoprotein-sorting protein [Planctomycetota bacterium]|nr:hypothetical protein [Planctomycetaceae bacterium]MDQ3331299.1 outer membrane lipoprotein-sorting protein [Planctomycetota bacterium]